MKIARLMEKRFPEKLKLIREHDEQPAVHSN